MGTCTSDLLTPIDSAHNQGRLVTSILRIDIFSVSSGSLSLILAQIETQTSFQGWHYRACKFSLILLCIYSLVCVHSVTQTCLTFWDTTNCSLPGSSVHGILQARTLQWIAISSFWGSSWPRDWTWVSCIGRQILYCWAIRIYSPASLKNIQHAEIFLPQCKAIVLKFS